MASKGAKSLEAVGIHVCIYICINIYIYV
jgi:hypothetical protein